MLLKNFIDLLFILLICAIVLLSESIRIGAVETAPPIIAAQGAASMVEPAEIRVVVVNEDHLILDEQSYDTAQALANQLQRSDTVLIVSGTEQITHHRMMGVWSGFQELGFAVKLGVQPESKQAPNS